METESVLKCFDLESVRDRVYQTVWGGQSEMQNLSPRDSLQAWLELLPEKVTGKIELALNQDMPFMPPDFTPDVLSAANDRVPSENHIDVICVCLHFAMETKDHNMAAALIYTVDRALYRFGRSKPLLRVVSDLRRVSPETAVAPQVTLRSARVMKDEGDLNGALKVIHAIISREDGWHYKDERQYLDTKAACLHVQGQIYHNLELWHYAIPPLVEGFRIFQHVQDRKGIGSCLHVLCRCLCHLQQHQYDQLRGKHPDVFEADYPCYEGYRQGQGAVQNVQHIADRFFVAKHQLAADESLLMFAVQNRCPVQFQQLLQQILMEIRESLSGHRTVQNLQNLESFVEFVRAVFLASLVLWQSCSQELEANRQHSRFLEDLSLKLYKVMCCPSGEKSRSTTLEQTPESVRVMNEVLVFLGLPELQGSSGFGDLKPGGRTDQLSTTADERTEKLSRGAPAGTQRQRDGVDNAAVMRETDKSNANTENEADVETRSSTGAGGISCSSESSRPTTSSSSGSSRTTDTSQTDRSRQTGTQNDFNPRHTQSSSSEQESTRNSGTSKQEFTRNSVSLEQDNTNNSDNSKQKSSRNSSEQDNTNNSSNSEQDRTNNNSSLQQDRTNNSDSSEQGNTNNSGNSERDNTNNSGNSEQDNTNNSSNSEQDRTNNSSSLEQDNTNNSGNSEQDRANNSNNSGQDSTNNSSNSERESTSMSTSNSDSSEKGTTSTQNGHNSDQSSKSNSLDQELTSSTKNSEQASKSSSSDQANTACISNITGQASICHGDGRADNRGSDGSESPTRNQIGNSDLKIANQNEFDSSDCAQMNLTKDRTGAETNKFTPEMARFKSPRTAKESQSVPGKREDLMEHGDSKTVESDLKVTTFPSASHRRYTPSHRRAFSHRNDKYVGLTMSREELRAATWPALSAEPELSLGKGDNFMESEDENLDALSLSANTKSSDKLTNKLSSNTSASSQKGGPLGAAQNSFFPASIPQSTALQGSLTTPQCLPSATPLYHPTKTESDRMADSIHACSSCSQSRSRCSTVDRDASTKSSSPDTPQDSISREAESDSLVSSLQRRLGLGLQQRQSAEHVLTTWTPSDDRQVHRATLFTFNAWTAEWSRQTTLVYLGDALPLADKNPRGAFRDAFLVSFLHQDEPLARYVGKKYRREQKPFTYLQDVEHQMLASYYVTIFNEALNTCQTEFLRIHFLPAFHLQLLNEQGEVVDWLNVEPFMDGRYHKLTNNATHVTNRQELVKGLQVATAFSHFSYVHSDGNYMVVDLQGCVPDDNEGVIYLTDPVLHTARGKTEVTSFDRHEKGMADFWNHVHPDCNEICRFLKLDQKRPFVENKN